MQYMFPSNWLNKRARYLNVILDFMFPAPCSWSEHFFCSEIQYDWTNGWVWAINDLEKRNCVVCKNETLFIFPTDKTSFETCHTISLLFKFVDSRQPSCRHVWFCKKNRLHDLYNTFHKLCRNTSIRTIPTNSIHITLICANSAIP